MSLTDHGISKLAEPIYGYSLDPEDTQDLQFARAIESATAAPLLERIKELERQVGTLDSTVTEIIKEREHAQGMADDLATAIGKKFRVDPGEHSNMNCPWTTALAIIGGEYITDSDQDRRIAELEQQLEAARKDAERLDYLDKLNARLNTFYGTTYRWRLVLSPNIVRLMSGRHANGHVGDIDLHDSEPNGAESCRAAIDAAISKEQA